MFCAFTRASLYVLWLVFMFNVFPLCCCLVVSTSAINCLQRLISKMTYYVSGGALNPTHSLTPDAKWRALHSLLGFHRICSLILCIVL